MPVRCDRADGKDLLLGRLLQVHLEVSYGLSPKDDRQPSADRRFVVSHLRNLNCLGPGRARFLFSLKSDHGFASPYFTRP